MHSRQLGLPAEGGLFHTGLLTKGFPRRSWGSRWGVCDSAKTRAALRLGGPLCLALLALVGWGAACSGPEREPDTPAEVTLVRVEGALDVGTLGLLRRAFAYAELNRHERLVVELDTPGGEVELMWELAG